MAAGSDELTPLATLGERDARLDALIERGLNVAGIRASAAAVIIDLDKRCHGAYRGEADIYPASVIKVPVMVEAYHQYALGSLMPDARVVIDAANQTTTDQVTPFVTGYEASVQKLVELMITHSDNIATNQLFDVLGRSRVTEYMHRLGLPTFFLGRKLSGSEPLIHDPGVLGRNRLPPQEIAHLLALIADDAVSGAGDQRAILSRCVHAEKLVPALRAGDAFMHKTGETDTVSHDAGILTTAQGRRYVVVLYLEVEPNPDGSDAAHANPLMTAWMAAVRPSL